MAERETWSLARIFIFIGETGGGLDAGTAFAGGNVSRDFTLAGLGVVHRGLAQPRLMKSGTTVKASGVDIAVAFDLSGSMLSEDFVVKDQRVNRFNMARSVLKQFIEERPGDRIGLIVFASQAYIATPLTLDHEFLLENLDRLEIGTINQNQTAIGDALSTAVNRLRDLKSKSKIVILMTDGQNNSAKFSRWWRRRRRARWTSKFTPSASANRAPRRCRSVGIRTPVRRCTRNTVDVDEETLQKIADETGGKYYRADNAERFKQIYAEIDKLEKTEAVINKYTELRNCSPGWCWPDS
ncbi:MAG: VWA domain-containing protein [Limisphaerales bacterium]